MDTIGKNLQQKVADLLRAKGDDWPALGTAIKRGPSWVSEFSNGKRTTNDLRLVVKMARYFGVPVSCLLSEPGAKHDASTAMLLGAIELLEERDRRIVLRLALDLRAPKVPEE